MCACINQQTTTDKEDPAILVTLPHLEQDSGKCRAQINSTEHISECKFHIQYLLFKEKYVLPTLVLTVSKVRRNGH